MKNINLLPPKTKEEKQRSLFYPLMIGFAFILVAGQLYLGFYWTLSSEDYAVETEKLQQQVNEFKTNGQSRIQVERFKQASQLVENLKNSQPDWMSYLSPMISHLPETAIVQMMNMDEQGNIQADIDFKTYESCLLYLQQLEQAPQLQGVLLSSYYKKYEENTSPTEKALYNTYYKLMLKISRTESKGAGQ